MRQIRSTIRIFFSTRYSCHLLWALGIALFVSAAGGDEPRPVAAPLEEPKALLGPIKLIPVEKKPTAPATPADSSVAGPSVPWAWTAPPIRLAPAPLPLHAGETKHITESVDGIRPASFKGITPGKSTYDDIVEKIGDPLETTASDDKEELVFKLGPFPSVKITLTDKIVSSIVIRLAKPTTRDDVSKELNLGEFDPVTIRDESDHAIGEVYPERGLMFAYQGPADSEGTPQVGQVVLERVSVEPFLLRVEQTPEQQIKKRLDNLHVVQRLVPDDAEAYAIAARLDLQCGRLTAALDAAQKASKIDAEKAGYQILLADVNRQLGHHQEALQAVREVLADGAVTSLEKAEAKYILGRLLAAMPGHDYKTAMNETVSAIKIAAAETKSQQAHKRRQARRQLIRAELSLAEILSYGPWKQRHTVVPQWLASAEKAANEYIEKDGAPREILLDIYSTSLHCLLVLDGQGSPEKIADAAIRLGRTLIAESEDLDYQSLVEWKLGTGLWFAARIEQQQGHANKSLRMANNADALLSSAGELRHDSPETLHHLAQLHFLMGSIYAIQRKDDATASRWYDKAMPHLIDPYPDTLLDDRGLVGEQLVSVGITLWGTGRRNKAVAVTEKGTALINDAVKAGTFKRVALAIPYQNLAQMHREMGNDAKADKMARKAAEYEPANASKKKRR